MSSGLWLPLLRPLPPPAASPCVSVVPLPSPEAAPAPVPGWSLHSSLVVAFREVRDPSLALSTDDMDDDALQNYVFEW